MRNDEKTRVTAEIESLNTKLSQLRANIDLFPTELESFVSQGSKNTRTLFWLSAAPIGIIGVMFFLLISGAVDLTTQIDPEDKVNIGALIASRTPYVVVALAIITSCYKIAKFFMLELIEINRQRLNLTKIGIIAKDVSNAAESGLDISEVEKYTLRVRLKMELLKDHLKGYISSNIDVHLPNVLTGPSPFSEITNFSARKRLDDGKSDKSGSEA